MPKVLKKKGKDEEKQSVWRFLLDVVVNSIVIIVIFYLVQYFLFAPFQVVGRSMVNTLHDGEYIIISKIGYYLHEPERGDIVVFKPPSSNKDYYIKRIVGIPGDEVKLSKGKVFVNDKETQEEYIYQDVPTCLIARMSSCPNDSKIYQVPEGKYFVLGDNRAGSSDSRTWHDADNREIPFVEKGYIEGKAKLVLLPVFSVRLIPEVNSELVN
ncbi:MAG TPA: signal peptidase I [Candidatus Peregrinibacteria bacterium]|nr:signal peptidase I [Candidatus Peregrinibacteria bacterium]